MFRGGFINFALFISILSICYAFKLTTGGILLLDHLNINHEKSRHDLVKAFYFETLGLVPDPRKNENLEKGRKTLWANAGITQFHLPEADIAQKFNGVITLSYPDLNSLNIVKNKLENPIESLRTTKFGKIEENADGMLINDPWGNLFRLIVNPDVIDSRGTQPGEKSLPCSMNLCVFVPARNGLSLEGIARFYDYVLDAPSTKKTADSVSIVVSPYQTLTFIERETEENLSEEEVERDDSGKIIAHSGAHISMYVADLSNSYLKAERIGATFVNERFKRKAYTLDEAVDQCMFRILDIVEKLGPINKKRNCFWG